MERGNLTPVSKPGDCSEAGATATTAVPAVRREKTIADSILSRKLNEDLDASLLLLVVGKKEKNRRRVPRSFVYFIPRHL